MGYVRFIRVFHFLYVCEKIFFIPIQFSCIITKFAFLI